jgi:predicted ester cyclase
MPESSGRSAIRSAAERAFAAFGDAKLSTGRIWIKDAHSALEFVSDDYVSPDTLRGAPALRGLLGELTKAVPDLRAAVTTSFAAGDDGVFEMEFAGTPNGGKRIDVHEIQVNQFKDGRMTRSWSWSNGAEN